MKKALKEILPLTRGGLRYQVSIAEKENDTGLMWNQRLLFLLEGQHLSYLSEIKLSQSPQNVDFKKSKYSVLLSNIKSVSVDKQVLSIKFNHLDNNKKLERNWFFKLETEQLARQWHEKIQQQKVAISLRSRSPKRQTESRLKEEPHQTPIKSNRKIVQPQKLDLTKEYNVFYVGNSQHKPTVQDRGIGEQPIGVMSPKQVKQFKEIGTSVTPKSSQANFQQLKIVNPRDSQSSSKFLKQKQQSLSRYPKQKQPNLNQDQPIDNKPPESKKFFASDSAKPLTKQNSQQQVYGLPQEKRVETKSIKKNKQKSQLSVQPQIANQLSNRIYVNSNSLVGERKQQKSNNGQSYYERTSDIVKQTRMSDTKLISRNLIRSDSSEGKISSKRDSLSKIQSQPQKQSNQLTPQRSSASSIGYNFIARSQLSYKQSDAILEEQFSEQLDQQQLKLDDSLPWTLKYIKHRELIYPQFEKFTEQLMSKIINDFQFQENKRKYKPKLKKDGLYFYQIQDISVKFSVIGLDDIFIGQEGQGTTQRICQVSAIKQINTQFNNFRALNHSIHNVQKLSVPLMSVCQQKGFVALFKVESVFRDQHSTPQYLAEQLKFIQANIPIEHNFKQRLHQIILPLDSEYYLKIDPQFDPVLLECCMIQEINGFLVQDFLNRQDGRLVKNTQILREQLIKLYIEPGKFLKNPQNTRGKKQSASKQNDALEIQQFSKNVLKAIADIIPQIDNLSSYFINSAELTQFLHNRGINIRYIGALYQNLKSPFAKKCIMTEIAARCCKTLFRKTLQDIYIEDPQLSQEDLLPKLIDFVNCVFGSTYQTAAIWKVLSIHSRSTFKVDLDFEQIHKGLFLIAVVQHCRLKVVWEKIRPDEAFRVNNYFSDRNLLGIQAHHKTLQPVHNVQYRKLSALLQKDENSQGHQTIVSLLGRGCRIAPHLAMIASQIKKYLVFFINPEKAMQQEYSSLGLFYARQNEKPSRESFQLQIMQIKWYLKLGKRDRYVKCCDDFIKRVTKYFGEFFPLFSELYDLFSAYHLSNCEYEDAITFAKSSLVNVLKICGSNNQKTSECYYHLALCYLKANRREEAITHIRKSKFIFESNGHSKTVPYALMSIKLALLYLNQNQTDECLRSTLAALDILQNQENREAQVTDAYQMLARCYELLKLHQQMKELSKICYSKLGSMRQSVNFEKLFKVYLYYELSNLSSDRASNYLDIISLLPLEANPKKYQISEAMLRARIAEGTLVQNVSSYFDSLNSLARYIGQNGLLSDWKNLSEVYQRETVSDFISLTEELLYFLGEGYVTGSLREAL